MAEDQVGMRKDVLQQLAPWTKIFGAFKVALDPKKLLLAGAGILTMQLGWWFLAMVYFGFNSTKPEWGAGDYPVGKTPEEIKANWSTFKRDRQIWNLCYEMAGTPPTTKDGKPAWVQYDIGDLADSPQDYEDIHVEQGRIRNELARLDDPIQKKTLGNQTFLSFGEPKQDVLVKFEDENQKKQVEAELDKGTFRVRDLTLPGEGKNDTDIILSHGHMTFKLMPGDANEVLKAKNYKLGARTVDAILAEVKNGTRKAHITNAALQLRLAKYKPYGRLRTLPWFEDRGPNPYLVVTGNIRSDDGTVQYLPWAKGQFLAWAVSEEVPVLLEPLVKFFLPIVYVFDPAAGFWNRIYLFLVILWSLATWALFGGAITRIAAVQVARATERVSMTEALRFAWTRYKSYLFAPLFPLLFVFIIVAVLFVFGLLEAWTFLVGDIVGGVLWPLTLLAGLIMAVVLVGLVGWPLMYTTISAEGSDSFDAISRSYSYVYQAPWHYLWYTIVALAYGAVLVFFVGFMGSLTVYLSKWAVASGATLKSREPSYLFQWAPTSYGSRDLLLFKSPNAEIQDTVNTRGQPVKELGLKVPDAKDPDFDDLKPNWHNYIGTFFVTVWLYLMFLLVIGFGYSYFWTASTIIYLLMRKKVDETELDEIHLEEEPEQPFPAPVIQTPPSSEAIKPNTTPVTMVESPTLRSSVAATPNTPQASAPAPAPAPAPTPPAAPPTATAEPAPVPPTALPTATPEPNKETPPTGDGEKPH